MTSKLGSERKSASWSGDKAFFLFQVNGVNFGVTPQFNEFFFPKSPSPKWYANISGLLAQAGDF